MIISSCLTSPCIKISTLQTELQEAKDISRPICLGLQGLLLGGVTVVTCRAPGFISIKMVGEFLCAEPEFTGGYKKKGCKIPPAFLPRNLQQDPLKGPLNLGI